eukprot:786539-Ditylum_brightwellii.AAC.1
MQLSYVTQAESATRAAMELMEVLKAPTPKAIFGSVGVEEKSLAKEKTWLSLRVEETSTEIKPPVPNTRVTKLGNHHNGPHIIPPDDGEKPIEYVPSASNEGAQLGPDIILLDEPTHCYQTCSQMHQMNHVATLNKYSSKELLDTLRGYWKEQEKRDYH